MIYEVVFSGGDGCHDTIYLVRAPSFRAAVDLVSASADPRDHGGHHSPIADIVYEIGTDASPHANVPNILFGPFRQFAYDYGWKAWHRAVRDGERKVDWEAKTNAA